MKSKKIITDKNSFVKVSDLKKETIAKQPLHNGYNKKNPTQPQGAFKPDSAKK